MRVWMITPNAIAIKTSHKGSVYLIDLHGLEHIREHTCNRCRGWISEQINTCSCEVTDNQVMAENSFP
jgi:hypothetical protein